MKVTPGKRFAVSPGILSGTPPIHPGTPSIIPPSRLPFNSSSRNTSKNSSRGFPKNFTTFRLRPPPGTALEFCITKSSKKFHYP